MINYRKALEDAGYTTESAAINTPDFTGFKISMCKDPVDAYDYWFTLATSVESGCKRLFEHAINKKGSENDQ